MKKNITKRILVVALTLVTTFTSLPMNVFAEDINSNIETESVQDITLSDESNEAELTGVNESEVIEEILDEAVNAESNAEITEEAKLQTEIVSEEVKEEIPANEETLSDAVPQEQEEIASEPINEEPIEAPVKSAKKMMLAKGGPYGGGQPNFTVTFNYDSKKSNAPYLTLEGTNDVVNDNMLINGSSYTLHTSNVTLDKSVDSYRITYEDFTGSSKVVNDGFTFKADNDTRDVTFTLEYIDKAYIDCLGLNGTGEYKRYYYSKTSTLVVIPDCEFTYPGHIFDHWVDEKGITYTPGQVIGDGFSVPSILKNNHTFSAKWTVDPTPSNYVTANIDYDANISTAPYFADDYTGSNKVANDKLEKGKTYYLFFGNIIDEDYKIACVYVNNVRYDSNGQAVKISEDASQIEVKASYNKRTVFTYEANNGTGKTYKTYVERGQLRLLTPEDCGFTYENHYFDHWEINGSIYNPGSYGNFGIIHPLTTSDQTVIAIWKDEVPASYEYVYEPSTIDIAKPGTLDKKPMFFTSSASNTTNLITDYDYKEGRTLYINSIFNTNTSEYVLKDVKINGESKGNTLPISFVVPSGKATFTFVYIKRSEDPNSIKITTEANIDSSLYNFSVYNVGLKNIPTGSPIDANALSKNTTYSLVIDNIPNNYSVKSVTIDGNPSNLTGSTRVKGYPFTTSDKDAKAVIEFELTSLDVNFDSNADSSEYTYSFYSTLDDAKNDANKIDTFDNTVKYIKVTSNNYSINELKLVKDGVVLPLTPEVDNDKVCIYGIDFETAKNNFYINGKVNFSLNLDMPKTTYKIIIKSNTDEPGIEPYIFPAFGGNISFDSIEAGQQFRLNLFNYNSNDYVLKKVTFDDNEIDFTDLGAKYTMPDHDAELVFTFEEIAPEPQTYKITFDSNYKDAVKVYHVTSMVPNYHELSDYSKLENGTYGINIEYNDNNYEITNVKVNGEDYADRNVFDVELKDEDVNIYVEFKKLQEYTYSFDSNYDRFGYNYDSFKKVYNYLDGKGILDEVTSGKLIEGHLYAIKLSDGITHNKDIKVDNAYTLTNDNKYLIFKVLDGDNAEMTIHYAFKITNEITFYCNDCNPDSTGNDREFHEYGSEISIPECKYVKDGYLFDHWIDLLDSNKEYHANDKVTMKGNLRLKPVWKAIPAPTHKANITYVNGIGENEQLLAIYKSDEQGILVDTNSLISGTDYEINVDDVIYGNDDYKGKFRFVSLYIDNEKIDDISAGSPQYWLTMPDKDIDIKVEFEVLKESIDFTFDSNIDEDKYTAEIYTYHPYKPGGCDELVTDKLSVYSNYIIKVSDYGDNVIKSVTVNGVEATKYSGNYQFNSPNEDANIYIEFDVPANPEYDITLNYDATMSTMKAYDEEGNEIIKAHAGDKVIVKALVTASGYYASALSCDTQEYTSSHDTIKEYEITIDSFKPVNSTFTLRIGEIPYKYTYYFYGDIEENIDYNEDEPIYIIEVYHHEFFTIPPFPDNLVKPGYKFKYWSWFDTRKVGDVIEETTAGGSASVYPVFEKISSTITFDSNDAYGYMPSITVDVNKTIDVPECEYYKNGFEFDGWLLDGEKLTSNTFNVGTEDHVLKATWKDIRVDYNITSNMDDDNYSSSMFYYDLPDASTIKNDEKLIPTYKVALRVNSNYDVDYVSVNGTKATYDGNKNYYFFNVPSETCNIDVVFKTYKLDFEFKNNIGKFSPKVYDVNEEVTDLSKLLPGKSYEIEFKGYDSKNFGFVSSTIDGNNSSDSKIKFTMPSSNVTVNVEMIRINNTYLFLSNTGDDASYPNKTYEKLKDGDTFTIPEPSFNYPEHEFVNWTRVSDGKEFNAKDEVIINGDETFKANWKDVYYSITVISNIEEAELVPNVNNSTGRNLKELKKGDTFKVNLRNFDTDNYIIKTITLDGDEIPENPSKVYTMPNHDVIINVEFVKIEDMKYSIESNMNIDFDAKVFTYPTLTEVKTNTLKGNVKYAVLVENYKANLVNVKANDTAASKVVKNEKTYYVFTAPVNEEVKIVINFEAFKIASKVTTDKEVPDLTIKVEGKEANEALSGDKVEVVSNADETLFNVISIEVVNAETNDLVKDITKDMTFVMPAYNVTINAKYESKKFATITFDANTGKGTMEPIKDEIGTTVKLPSCTFKKNGYTFQGWLLDGKKVTEITLEKDVVVKASWKQNKNDPGNDPGNNPGNNPGNDPDGGNNNPDNGGNNNPDNGGNNGNNGGNNNGNKPGSTPGKAPAPVKPGTKPANGKPSNGTTTDVTTTDNTDSDVNADDNTDAKTDDSSSISSDSNSSIEASEGTDEVITDGSEKLTDDNSEKLTKDQKDTKTDSNESESNISLSLIFILILLLLILIIAIIIITKKVINKNRN